MTVALLETLATDLLENEDLLSPDGVVEDGGLYTCSIHIRSSDLDFPVLVEEKHLVEFDLLILRGREAIDKKLGTSFNFKLLSGNVYDCVHLVNKLS